MKFDYIFWDVDGTLYNNHEKGKKQMYQGLRKLMKKIHSEKQGIITNNPFMKNIVNTFHIENYFNSELLFEPDSEILKVLENKMHPLRNIVDLNENYEENYGKLEKYIEKPSPYMFFQALKKIDTKPSKCVMIGDSYEDIIGAQLVGFKTIYLSGLEENQSTNTNNLMLEPNYEIHAGDISALEIIIFKKRKNNNFK